MAEKKIEQSALKAIKKLRREKFKNGQPFMINSEMLVSEQCFLEFPDGIIKIAEACPKSKDFSIVYEYSFRESNNLRKQLKLM